MRILNFVNRYFIQFSVVLLTFTILLNVFIQIYDGYLEEISREQLEIFKFAGRLLNINIED
jgi:hypothetical protein